MHAYVHLHPIDFTWDCPNNVLDLWSQCMRLSYRIIKCAMQRDRFETSSRYIILYWGRVKRKTIKIWKWIRSANTKFYCPIIHYYVSLRTVNVPWYSFWSKWRTMTTCILYWCAPASPSDLAWGLSRGLPTARRWRGDTSTAWRQGWY